MKTSRNEMNPQNKQGVTKVPKPDIRDNLDSREGEEWQTKGDDVTHNKKATRNNKQKKEK